MERQGIGSIANISTFAVFDPDPMFPTSGVVRAGLAFYTKLFSFKVCSDGHTHEQRSTGLC